MLPRFVSAAIVLFWLTMTTLLVRSELWPDHSQVRTVPVAHVAKLMWLHKQPSDLTIWSEGLRAGHFHIEPAIREVDEARLIKYSGNLQLRLPGARRQRVSWDGIADFGQTTELQSILIGLGLRDPSPMRAEITLDPATNLAHYRLTNNGVTLEDEEYTLDEAGLKKALEQLELDPAVFSAMRGSSKSTAELTAHQGSLTLYGQRIDTYVLALKQGGQTLLEAHVSQLGQVLHVKTLVGYTMAPENVAP